MPGLTGQFCQNMQMKSALREHPYDRPENAQNARDRSILRAYFVCKQQDWLIDGRGYGRTQVHQGGDPGPGLTRSPNAKWVSVSKIISRSQWRLSLRSFA